MKFDTVIIGGGLAGLASGILLQQSGRKTAIVSAGQSALHFFSGSFEGWREEDLGGIEAARKLFDSIGITLRRGGFRLTPTGTFRHADLAIGDISLFEGESIGSRKALIVNFEGYHDFFVPFIAEGLDRSGTACRSIEIHVPEVEQLRRSPSEMRSVGIARVLERHWQKVVDEILKVSDGEEATIVPQVFGLHDDSVLEEIRRAVPGVVFVGTMPPSVPGIRTQWKLRKAYESLGGTFMMGDEAVGAAVHEGTVSSITTRNLEGYRLMADSFILASGGFFSKGLESTPTRVYEPLFGLDVEFLGNRSEWYDRDFFATQPYMGFGPATTPELNAIAGGKPLRNLYVAGSILGSTRPELGSDAALALNSAFLAVRSITGNTTK